MEVSSQQHLTRNHHHHPPPPPPPPPLKEDKDKDEDKRSRRPKVREVNSRFMSPIVVSEIQRRHHLTQFDPQPLTSFSSSSTHDNNISETPFPFNAKVVGCSQRKRGAAIKLFKENNNTQQFDYSRLPPQDTLHFKTKRSTAAAAARHRTDTPTSGAMDRLPKSTHANTAAAKLLQSSGMTAKRNRFQDGGVSTEVEESSSSHSANNASVEISVADTDLCPTSHVGGVECLSPPIPVQSFKMRPISDFRSSMPEAPLSVRLLAERNAADVNVLTDSSRLMAFPCHRSLNSAPSISQQSVSPTKSTCKSSSLFSKSYSSSTKTAPICLPPNPSNMKSGKGRKVSSHQEDVHLLRLLQNRYLQWRFANVKAEAAMNTQKSAAERSLSALVDKISELRDSVTRKHIELGQFKMIESLYTILNAQMPYLEQWDALEGEYSSSLLGAIKALQDASLRLPVTGNIDIAELSEALKSATNLMVVISPLIESFLPKAERVDNLISELARIVNRERTLIEECGHLLSMSHMLQVEECSLRGQLIQLKQEASLGNQITTTTTNSIN
ncbi:uncharacterized protein LOC143878171 isoform X2 [Tasmannia lanceolata]|uniref:uncharacterized protein LOC143878171 isoform X2 n=1 Tax=Tasmannia lanceolata TaxID=3420 RepID=UPI0040643BDA